MISLRASMLLAALCLFAVRNDASAAKPVSKPHQAATHHTTAPAPHAHKANGHGKVVAAPPKPHATQRHTVVTQPKTAIPHTTTLVTQVQKVAAKNNNRSKGNNNNRGKGNGKSSEQTFEGRILSVQHHHKNGNHHSTITVEHFHRGNGNGKGNGKGNVALKNNGNSNGVKRTFHITSATRIHAGGGNNSGKNGGNNGGGNNGKASNLHKGLRIIVRHHGQQADVISIEHRR